MRVSRLIPLAFLSLFAVGRPAAAETAPQPVHGASETVGALSPNEQKRAERARARAAAATTPAPPAAAVAKRDAPAIRDVAAASPASRLVATRRTSVADRPVRRRAASRDVDPARPPRVGDMIPPGVPLHTAPLLYPSPYRQAEMVDPRGYRVYPAYRPYARPYPPFPRSFDD